MAIVKAEDTKSLASVKTVNDAAEYAKDRADYAAEQADLASASADEAKTSALAANTAASAALNNLATVEDVVDVLNWISQHGEYDLTEDVAVIPGKWYFELIDGAYSVTQPDDDADPSALGLYELTSVDSAVSNYISTHLALTDAGLFVQIDESKARLQITSTGINLYNEAGDIIATYSDTITLGDVQGSHITLSEGELAFWHDSSTRVAWMSASSNSSSKLYISEAEITENLRIGNFVWIVQSEQRMSLRYSPRS